MNFNLLKKKKKEEEEKEKEKEKEKKRKEENDLNFLVYIESFFILISKMKLKIGIMLSCLLVYIFFIRKGF